MDEGRDHASDLGFWVAPQVYPHVWRNFVARQPEHRGEVPWSPSLVPARRSTFNTIPTRGIGESRGLFEGAKRSIDQRRDLDKCLRDILPKHWQAPEIFATTLRRW